MRFSSTTTATQTAVDVLKAPNMVDRPSLTVVIPAYNEADRIGACLDSLMAQTVLPEKIIVVDNNSTDETASIAASYELVNVIAESRQGISYARTTGFDAVESDIIARIDADTIANPTWVSTVHSMMANSQIAAVCGNAAITELSPPGKFWARWYYRNFRRWHERSIGISPMMYGFNCAMRRGVWKAIRDELSMGDDQISEDVDVTCAIMRRGHKIKYSDDLIVKCPVLRSFDIKKARRYYRTDNYTLAKHRIGNKRRWQTK